MSQSQEGDSPIPSDTMVDLQSDSESQQCQFELRDEESTKTESPPEINNSPVEQSLDPVFKSDTNKPKQTTQEAPDGLSDAVPPVVWTREEFDSTVDEQPRVEQPQPNRSQPKQLRRPNTRRRHSSWNLECSSCMCTGCSCTCADCAEFCDECECDPDTGSFVSMPLCDMCNVDWLRQ